MRTKILLVLLILSVVNLYIVGVDPVFSSGITQKCPKECDSSCTCSGNNCYGTTANCGGTVYCDCSDTNCHNSAQCPQSGGGGGGGSPPGPLE